jgi:hypothetical protein
MKASSESGLCARVKFTVFGSNILVRGIESGIRVPARRRSDATEKPPFYHTQRFLSKRRAEAHIIFLTKRMAGIIDGVPGSPRGVTFGKFMQGQWPGAEAPGFFFLTSPRRRRSENV